MITRGVPQLAQRPRQKLGVRQDRAVRGVPDHPGPGALLDDEGVRLYGVEAAGDGVETEKHAASIERGRPGVLHGAKTYVLQDEDGQTVESHSISAGLDYPGVGPEHAWLSDIGRAEYIPATDAEAMDALAISLLFDRPLELPAAPWAGCR